MTLKCENLFNTHKTSKWINVSIITVLICFLLKFGSTDDVMKNYDFERKLQRELSDKSAISILPPHSVNSPVKIAIDLLIIALQDLNEETESLTLDAWLKMKWNDSRLAWDKTMYGGLTSIKLFHHQLWQPDIKLYNRMKLSEIDSQKDVFAKVQSTGEVEWISPSTFASVCAINLKFFPFDVQKCFLTFGSWTENGNHIDMELLHHDGKMEFNHFFNENNQWEIVDNRSRKDIKYLPCCEEPFSEVTFELRLRRRSPYYKYIILFPVLGVAALMLSTFWLPPQAMDKLLLSSTCFLSLVIILLHLSLKLPPAGKTVPMIVIFCGHLTLMVIVSTIMSIISIVWSRSEYNRSPPKWLRSHLNSFLGKILCTTLPVFPSSFNHNDECNSLEMEVDDKSFPGEKDRQQYYKQQWVQCFQMFDRITFVLMAAMMSFALAGSFTFNQ